MGYRLIFSVDGVYRDQPRTVPPNNGPAASPCWGAGESTLWRFAIAREAVANSIAVAKHLVRRPARGSALRKARTSFSFCERLLRKRNPPVFREARGSQSSPFVRRRPGLGARKFSREKDEAYSSFVAQGGPKKNSTNQALQSPISKRRE